MGSIVAAAASALVLAPLALTLTPAHAADGPNNSSAGNASQSANEDAAPLKPSTALTPPMGYNNWAQDMCDIDAQLFKDQANALVDSGLAEAGYDTVTVDDCWMQKDRDADGNLQVRTNLFPEGMDGLGEYIHDLGLNYGIYLDAGVVTCSGGNYMGSYGHIKQDINLLASWGVDYVKMDGCNVPSVSGETQEETYKRVYTSVAEAMNDTGREITFSNSSPAYFSIPAKTPAWYTVMDWSGDISELWRESWDIDVFNGTQSRWPGIMRNYDYNKTIQRFSSVGHWNDPDFIIGGNAGVTDTEGRTQLTLWSMMASPLILSTDVTALEGQYLEDLKNPGMLAIDQDPLGEQATLISSDSTGEVLYRPLEGGDFAIGFLNRSSSSATVSTTAEKLGFEAGGQYHITDVWSGDESDSNGQFEVSLPAHGSALLRVSATGADFAAPSGQVMTPNETVCIDASAGAGEGVTQAACDGSEDQRITRAPARALAIADTGMCLEPESTQRGAAVTIDSCDGSSSQAWGYTKHGQLINDEAALCLGSSTGSTSAGAALTINTCGADPLYQIWSVPGAATDAVTPLPPAPPSGTFWASDATPASASVGYGVLGKDVAIKDTATSADVPLQPYWTDPETGETPTYDKGWGTHAPSVITYDLAGNCTRFTTDMFLQNGFEGHVQFSIVTDGETVYTSEPAENGTAPQHADIDLDGVQQIELRVDPAPGYNMNAAHADWGNPQFVCNDGDTTAPTVEAELSQDLPDSGWFTSPVDVTLSASDDSDIFAIQYRMTSKARDSKWLTYTEPIAVAEGETTVEYRAIDSFGNQSEPETVSVKVDQTPPTVTASNAERNLTLEASDELSGIAAIEYSVDDGATWLPYTAPVDIPGNEETSVLYRASDVAGLTSKKQSIDVPASSDAGDGSNGDSHEADSDSGSDSDSGANSDSNQDGASDGSGTAADSAGADDDSGEAGSAAGGADAAADPGDGATATGGSDQAAGAGATADAAEGSSQHADGATASSTAESASNPADSTDGQDQAADGALASTGAQVTGASMIALAFVLGGLALLLRRRARVASTHS